MSIPPPPPTPTIDRLRELQPEIAELSQFLEWLVSEAGGGVDLFRLPDGMWGHDFRNSRQLMCAYYHIDMNQLETERQALLAYARQLMETP